MLKQNYNDDYNNDKGGQVDTKTNARIAVLTINLNITVFEKLKAFRYFKSAGIFIFPEMSCILGQLLVFQINYALDEGLTLEISTSKSLFSGHLISKVLPWSLDWLL